MPIQKGVDQPTHYALPKPADESEYLTVNDVVRFVLRNLWLLALSMFLFGGLAYYYANSVTEEFTARATILIDREQPIIGGLGDNTIALGAAPIDDDLQVILSDEVLIPVVNDLDLLADPEFAPQPGMTAQIKAIFTGPRPPVELTVEQDMIVTLAILRGKLTVRRAGQSNVLNLFTRTSDRVKAAQITNAVADSFIAQEIGAKATAARRGSAWLSNRLGEVREFANEAAIKLEDFKSSSELTDYGDGRFLRDQQLVQLNDQMMTARFDMRLLSARVETLRAALGEDLNLNRLPELPNNPLVLNLRQQIAAQQGLLRDLSSRFGENALNTQNARRELDALLTELRAEVERSVETLNAEFRAAQLNATSLAEEIEELNFFLRDKRDARVEYQELASQSSAFRVMYESLLQQYMRSVQLESFPVTDARIVTRASVPLGKSHPRTSLILVGGMVVGLLFGLGLGLARLLFSRPVESAYQVSRRTALSCIGQIPSRRRRELLGARKGIRLFDKRNARYTLALREMWSAIQSVARPSDMKDRRRPLVIGFTGLKLKDANTSVTIDLAQVIATQDQRVLFVSSRPIGPLPGLDYDQEFDWLDGTNFNSATMRIAGGEIVLVAPNEPFTATMVRGSTSMATIVSLDNLIRNVSGDFSTVLIDLPVIGEAPEIRQVQQHMDALFLLARYRHSKLDDLVDVADASGPGDPLLSGYTILNSRRRRRRK